MHLLARHDRDISRVLKFCEMKGMDIDIENERGETPRQILEARNEN